MNISFVRFYRERMTNEPKNCLEHRFTHSNIYIYLYKKESGEH